MSEKQRNFVDVWFAVGSLAGVLAREDGAAYFVDILRKMPMLAVATAHLRDRLNDVLQAAEVEFPGHTEP